MTQTKSIPAQTKNEPFNVKIKNLISTLKASRPMRAVQRFNESNGPTLCGGIAYTALFSIFGALAIGYTILARVLGNNRELMDSVLQTVDEYIPGLVDADGTGGALKPEDLIQNSGLTLTSIIGGVVLLWAALGCMSAIRRSCRMMFDLSVQQSNMVRAKLRELGGLVIIGLTVVLATVSNLAVTGLGRWLISTLNLPAFTSWLIPVAVIVVGFVLDALAFILVVRVLAGVRLERRDQLYGAGIAAVGFGVIRQLGTSVVAGSVSSNPLLGAFAVIVILLLWINLTARIFLMAAAFAGNPSLESLEPKPTSEPESPQAQESREETAVPKRSVLPWLMAVAAFFLGRRNARSKQDLRHRKS